MQPYIGITGFTSPEELTAVTALKQPSDHALMAGIITSNKTFSQPRGRIRVSLDELEAVTRAMPSHILGAVHHHTPYNQRLEEELMRILDHANGTRLVQINTTWPDPAAMQRVQEAYGVTYVLQFPPQALADGPAATAKRAAEYHGLASQTLVDPSQGAGKRFDPTRAAEFLNAVAQTLPDATMGVAGGLDGYNVEEQIAAVRGGYTGPLSIDAEGRLRRGDRLDMGKVAHYLQAAERALKKEEKN